MQYTLPITKKGTVTIPKKIRDELQVTDKIVLAKVNGKYFIKPVKDIFEMVVKIPKTQKTNLEEAEKIRKETFAKERK